MAEPATIFSHQRANVAEACKGSDNKRAHDPKDFIAQLRADGVKGIVGTVQGAQSAGETGGAA